MYAPTLSEVVYRPLEVVIGALKKAHIYALAMYLKKKKKEKEEEKKRKTEQCYKLLVVLGGGLAPTRSYIERWQVARCVAVVQCAARLKLQKKYLF